MNHTARDALVRSICARLNDDRRSEDEIRIMDHVLAGLEQGANVYGAMDLASDTRDMREEAGQEARDLLIYNAAAYVAAQHRRRERLACEVADEEQPIDTRLKKALTELRDSEPRIVAPLFAFDMGDSE